MQKNPSYHLATERRQVLTFALRASLEMLQMPQLELGQWLYKQIEKNPLLELEFPQKSYHFEPVIPKAPSGYESLACQIREAFLDPYDRKVAFHFLEHLDEKGFLSPSYEALKTLYPKYWERILATLQTLQPAGIFARSLQESLLLQLSAKGKTATVAFSIVQSSFDDLVHGRFCSIEKKLTKEDVKLAIHELSRLYFRPLSLLLSTPAANVQVDLKVRRVDTGWIVELVEDELPAFHIRTDYLDLKGDSKEEKETMQEFKTQAHWLFRSLSRRRALLRKMGALLIAKQARFLDGKGDLEPLSIKELAKELNVHESTVSRALFEKYAATPQGVISLKTLVEKSPEKLDLKQTLKDIIAKEDPKEPLTDEEIASLLQKKGFKAARRTVAKYRTQLKIGSAKQRKYQNNP